jgi:hypothetical protein
MLPECECERNFSLARYLSAVAVPDRHDLLLSVREQIRKNGYLPLMSRVARNSGETSVRTFATLNPGHALRKRRPVRVFLQSLHFVDRRNMATLVADNVQRKALAPYGLPV